MKHLFGYVFDGWNALMYGIQEIGKSIDQAWGDDDE